MKFQKREDLMAAALVACAESILRTNKDFVDVEMAKACDRAMRSCRSLAGHPVWVRWSYVAEKNGWLTEDELVFHKPTGSYRYPEK